MAFTVTPRGAQSAAAARVKWISAAFRRLVVAAADAAIGDHAAHRRHVDARRDHCPRLSIAPPMIFVQTVRLRSTKNFCQVARSVSSIATSRSRPPTLLTRMSMYAVGAARALREDPRTRWAGDMSPGKVQRWRPRRRHLGGARANIRTEPFFRTMSVPASTPPRQGDQHRQRPPPVMNRRQRAQRRKRSSTFMGLPVSLGPVYRQRTEADIAVAVRVSANVEMDGLAAAPATWTR